MWTHLFLTPEAADDAYPWLTKEAHIASPTRKVEGFLGRLALMPNTPSGPPDAVRCLPAAALPLVLSVFLLFSLLLSGERGHRPTPEYRRVFHSLLFHKRATHRRCLSPGLRSVQQQQPVSSRHLLSPLLPGGRRPSLRFFFHDLAAGSAVLSFRLALSCRSFLIPPAGPLSISRHTHSLSHPRNSFFHSN